MTAPTRTYTRTTKIHRVDVTRGGVTTSRLVRALTVAGAVAHVAGDTIRGRVASQDDLLTQNPSST